MKRETKINAKLREPWKKKQRTPLDSHFKKWIGIDPGKGGGICIISKDTVRAYKCPQTANEMATLFGVAIGGDAPIDVNVTIEQVWARPTNGSRHSFSYGTNYGIWFGLAAAHEVEMNIVSPQKWMSEVGCPKGMEVKQRKHWLKDKAKELYPQIPRVTLATADAIMIAEYGKNATKNS
jgi:hypothetical protein